MEQVFIARCLFCHSTNSVKALSGTHNTDHSDYWPYLFLIDQMTHTGSNTMHLTMLLFAISQ